MITDKVIRNRSAFLPLAGHVAEKESLSLKDKVDISETEQSSQTRQPGSYKQERFPLNLIDMYELNGASEVKAITKVNKIRYKDPKSKKNIEEDYEYKDIIAPNAERLETFMEESIRKLKVNIAFKLSDKIRELLANGELKRYIGDKKKITLNDFIKCIRVASVREGDFAATSADDDELIALVAYNALGEQSVKGKILPGFFSLPDGLLVPGDAKFILRVNVLAKHFLIDIKGFKTPESLKRLENYDKELTDAHLRIVLRTFSPQNLFNFLFPGFQDGDDPIIPSWKYFSYPNKWDGEEGKELAKRASRWVLQKEGVIKNNGAIDLQVLKDKNWSSIFYSEKYELGGMMVSCPFTKNIFEAIKLAIPEAIGFEENQIKPWEITHMNMWQAEDLDGNLLIDHLTKYLVENYLPRQGIKLLKENGNGRLDAKEAIKINWGQLYYKVCSSALVNSPVKAHEALQRVYDDSFGFENDQIKLWELRWEGKWDGEYGKELFKKAFLYYLVKDELGELNCTDGIRAVFTKEKFESKIQKERSNLQKIITDNGLMSGFRKIYNGNLNTAIKDIFNAPDEISQVRDVMKYLQSIIEKNNGKVEFTLKANLQEQALPVADSSDGFSEKSLSKDLQAYSDNSYIERETINTTAMDPLDIAYLDKIGKLPLLTAAEEVTLGRMVKENNHEAREEFIIKNIRLVASIAKKYKNNGLSYGDLLQEGVIGLMKAVEKFDPERGYKFSTYAAWWIKQSIKNALNNTSRIVKVTRHMLDKVKEVNEVEKKLSQNLDITIISDEQIAASLDITKEKVQEIKASKRQPVSINIPNHPYEKDNGYDVADESNHVESFALRADVELVLKSLTQRERKVIELRFGFDGNGTKTLEEVGKILKIHRERVRQLESKAIGKLRSPERAEKLEGYVNLALV